MDDRDRAARLSRSWDVIGRSDPDVAVDSDDLAEARRLHHLDRQPAPDPGFVARLEGMLMRPAPAARGPKSIEPPPILRHRDSGAIVWSGQPAKRSRLHVWRRWAVAAAVVIIAGGLTTAAVLFGGDDPASPTLLPAYGAASPDVLPGQDTPECDVPPRPTEDFVALLQGTPIVHVEYNPLDVVPPRDTAEAIEEVVRELTACRNARDVARYYALWTDEAILRAELVLANASDQSLLQGLIRSMDYVARLDGTPEPVAESGVWRLLRVEDVTLMSDGRVRALVSFRVPGGELTKEMYFVGGDGTVRLDDAVGWTSPADQPGTPSA